MAEFVGNEGLHQIVGGAELKSPEDILLALESGQHDYRRIRRPAGLQATQHLKPVHHRHQGVENDQGTVVRFGAAPEADVAVRLRAGPSASVLRLVRSWPHIDE